MKLKHQIRFSGDDICLLFLIASFLFFVAVNSFAVEVKIKDLSNIRGIRTNQLMGVGIVVGLNKTGDSAKSLTTNRGAAQMLTRLGIKVTDQEILSGSMASVLATADLPPFAKSGDHIDVRISTLGDAKSLAGGTLVLTQLQAGDGKIYATAQGTVTIGQANGKGPQLLTVSTLPQSATVEREFTPEIDSTAQLYLSLKNSDATTNRKIVDRINSHFKSFIANSQDVSSINVQIPDGYKGKTVEFISEFQELTIEHENKNMVVINERTGTIVMGADVTISPVTITHGDLSLSIGDKKKKDGPSEQRVVEMGGTTVKNVIETMSKMGVKPQDLISILQTLNHAGALQAEIKVM